MARREDIETSIWDEPDFQALSPAARFVYIWSFTNQRCGMAGIYKVARGQIELETGHSGVHLDRALEELQEARYLFYDGRVMFVRTRVKHLRTKSPSIAKSIHRDLQSIGNHPFVALWWSENENCGWLLSEVEKPGNIGDLYGSPTPPPHPPEGVQGSGQGQGHRSSRRLEQQKRQRNQLPDDFPDELAPHLDAAERVLGSLAERHGSKAVSRLSLASVVMARPRKPIVRAAHDCAAYWDGRGQRLKDVVAAYRNWLERTDDLAALEHLGPNPVNVVPLTRAPHLERMDAWKRGYPEEQSA